MKFNRSSPFLFWPYFVIAGLLVAGLTLFAHTQKLMAQNTVQVSIGDFTLLLGESVDVPILISAGTQQVAAATINLAYDSTALLVTGCTLDGSFGGSCGDNRTEGTVTFSAVSITGVSGDSRLATISFRRVGIEEQVSNLDLSVTTFADSLGSTINYSLNNGAITLADAESPTPTPTPVSGSAEVPPTPTPTVVPGSLEPPSTAIPPAFALDCATVSALPLAECEALIAIDESNNGNPAITWAWSWEDNPCAWLQIKCSDNHTRVLDLRDGGISNLPAAIGDFPNLLELKLSNNGLAGLPSEIDSLANLMVLSVRGNKLTSLPPEIGSIPFPHGFSQLDLSQNLLVELPPEIGGLSFNTASTLNLSNNLLASLPPELGDISFTDSGRLDLSGNQLAELPPEIGQLSFGTHSELDLSDNLLTELPPEIGSFAELAKLDLSGNQLSALPAEIGNLPVLRQISLNHNQLTELPASLGNLAFDSFGMLDLSSNQLTNLPPEIGNLTFAEAGLIDLSNNQLTTLPAEMGYLPLDTNFFLDDSLNGNLPETLNNHLILFLGVQGEGFVNQRRLRSNSHIVGQSRLGQSMLGQSSSGQSTMDGTSVSALDSGLSNVSDARAEGARLAENGVGEASRLQLIAKPHNGWQFVRWESTVSLGTEATEPCIEISANGRGGTTYTAVFEEKVLPPGMVQAIYLPMIQSIRGAVADVCG